MVDQYGRWTYQENTPDNKKCDMDLVADWIMRKNYKPLTNIENLAVMVVLHYEGALEEAASEGKEYFAMVDNNNDPMINIDDVEAFVEATGGLKEFDYAV